jgi:iduronate 2-sulfatase
MHTPHLDKLAGDGVLFRRAYCQFSWCNPSRASLLTSRRPDTTMVHNNSVFFRMRNPDFTTLPQYFVQNGYTTLGMGKIFHQMGLGNDRDEDLSWSERNFRPEDDMLFKDEGTAWQSVGDDQRKGRSLLDEAVTVAAKQTLRRVAKDWKKDNKNFFVAVGMKKPHLNFVFPEEFLQYYPLDGISMPKNPTASPDLPDIAWFTSFEVRGRKEYLSYTGNWTRTEPLLDWIVRDLRRAYYSSISYIDSLIGEILQELEDQGLADDTIVSFIGDHGFHLGEHSIVGKNTVFEVANNSPMIIRIPGVTDGGHVSDKLVEFVDLFPTLAELSNLPNVPYCPGKRKESMGVSLCTEGTSLVPLFRDMNTTQWKDRVFYQYPHYLGHGSAFCMGYSMRTEQYRYTEWVAYTYHEKKKVDWDHVCDVELYDHHVDPNETKNIAKDPRMENLRKDYRKKLREGWSSALPK